MAAIAKDPLQPMIFRPTGQHYSPGSTFKMITMFAALRSGRVTPSTTVDCNGGYRLGTRVWRCDARHGPVSLRAALQHSCDVYFYRMGDLLGINAIASMAREFGLGAPTGISVVAEVPGIVPDEAYYDKTPGGYHPGMALNTAIGQGDDNVTPLQLAMAYSTLANGGTLYQPQIVQRIETPDGQVVQQFDPKVTHKTELNPEHRAAIVDALTAVVNEGGTGVAARLPDVKVAGKTGTAQVARIGAVRLKAEQMDYWARDNAWFASFAPADNPEIVVVVLNEHAGFGAAGAAPTAGRVLKKYFELKKQDAEAAAPLAQPVPVPGGALAPSAPAGQGELPAQEAAVPRRAGRNSPVADR